MTVSPLAVANFFTQMNGGWLSSKKLQKLTYLSHAWNLAIDGEPLIAEGFEAWDKGPVNPTLYRENRYGQTRGGMFCDHRDIPLEGGVTPRHRQIFEAVWKRYGHLSGEDLSDMTHKPNTPWTSTYYDIGRNHRIPDDVIREHFLQLGNSGKGHS